MTFHGAWPVDAWMDRGPLRVLLRRTLESVTAFFFFHFFLLFFIFSLSTSCTSLRHLSNSVFLFFGAFSIPPKFKPPAHSAH